LLVFGGLLASADAQFERIAASALKDPATPLSHAWHVLLFAWFAIGFLYVVYLRPGGLVQAPIRRRVAGGPEAIMVLAALDVLFAVFVVLQLQNLFGGMSHVRATSHLTLAQYARRGFFQLMIVSALVMPVLGLADFVAGGSSSRRWVRRLSFAMVTLAVVIIASALQRLWLYQQSFGITQLRLYSTAFVLWLLVAFMLFTATVLTGRRERFVFALVVSGFVAAAALNLVNPDALIARIDMQRTSQRHVVGFDPYYVTHLSADAAPTIIANLRRVPRREQAVIARHLIIGSRAVTDDWRSWNLARSAASDAVGRHSAELAALR
jgi:hypothetical protein